MISLINSQGDPYELKLTTILRIWYIYGKVTDMYGGKESLQTKSGKASPTADDHGGARCHLVCSDE